MQVEPGQLTPRWTPLKPHKIQSSYWRSKARHCVVPAGRRSGKSELAKRKLVYAAMTAHDWCKYPDPRFFAAAPTVSQVKRIWWEDIKALIPSYFVYGRANESGLELNLINGSKICLLGMDKPERAEGSPWDGGVLDEYANMKEETWGAHIRPALSDRMGWCDFIGVPEGRNHYYDLYKRAQEIEMQAKKDGMESEWATFHWFSSDILMPSEIVAAKHDLDEITFKQEYEGEFTSYTGMAYWPFSDKVHCQPLEYNPNISLSLCFDFNVDPGVAVILQERLDHVRGPDSVTSVIGEVYIPRGSNTLMVVDKIISMFSGHKGRILCYGDVTGGARGSAKIAGSDWYLIRQRLITAFPAQSVIMNLPRHNPKERDRVNAMNSRLRSTLGDVRLHIDPTLAPNLVKDFECVCLVKGGSGEIDKSNPRFTHLTDALGYYVHRIFPVDGGYVESKQKYWK